MPLTTPQKEKLGLTLSGGGFRAAFFHVGVLAQMARLGLLRHVEVISTVSGGSIIGALYYLHLKRLLEQKSDDTIADGDYIAILEGIEGDFLKGVQRNLRMLTFRDTRKNWQMRRPDYSRSDHIGELYDEIFYRPALGPIQTEMIQMRHLKIAPMQPNGLKDTQFDPDGGNGNRKHKVPILLINATVLNTGHNWRFEASRMGEPPWDSDEAKTIDKNLRLQRPGSYDDMASRQQDVELGLAVAASACVPVIFHPLAISELYPFGIRVQLVDGGVHDNQGIEGLRERGCTHFIVSDASEQLDDVAEPDTRLDKVLGRAYQVLEDRIREEQLFRLLDTYKEQVVLLHLRKGLACRAIYWNQPDGKPKAAPADLRIPGDVSERFGVAQCVQDLLSRVRTDLDSFTEVEAYSLMADGYLMSEDAFKGAVDPWYRERISQAAENFRGNWVFLQIRPWLINPTADYIRQLEVAAKHAFKIFRLSVSVTLGTFLALVAVCFCIMMVLGWLWVQKQASEPAGLVALLCSLLQKEWSWLKAVDLSCKGWFWIHDRLSRSGNLLLLTALGLTLALLLPKFGRAVRFLRTPTERTVRFVTRGLLPAAGSFFIWLHLSIFDRLFLRHGQVARLGVPPAGLRKDVRETET